MLGGSFEYLNGNIFFFSAMHNFANMMSDAMIVKVVREVSAKKLIKFTTNFPLL